MNILVVDDDPISCRLLESMLAKSGFDSYVAKDGSEALNKLQNIASPRIVILDWMMPGVKGIDVCRFIRQFDDDSYTYIIMLTAKSDKSDLIECLAAGADDYIVKPCDEQELKLRLGLAQRIISLRNALIESNIALESLSNKLQAELLQPLLAVQKEIQQALSQSEPEHVKPEKLSGVYDTSQAIVRTLEQLLISAKSNQEKSNETCRTKIR